METGGCGWMEGGRGRRRGTEGRKHRGAVRSLWGKARKRAVQTMISFHARVTAGFMCSWSFLVKLILTTRMRLIFLCDYT
jgi:hypothetical protein